MKLGHIASGDDFFGRKAECRALWKYLKNDHIVASGPRRLGKSSIVNRLREEAITRGLLAEHVDVQGLESVKSFIEVLSKHFPDETVGGHLRTLSQAARSWIPLKKIEVNAAGVGASIELQAASSQEWSKAANELQARLQDVPALILIDEFSVFLQKLLEKDRREAEALLAWLRAWRVSPSVACRFFFTGSIGLNSLLERYGLTAQFNDCFEYPIPPFSASDARAMLREFAEKDGWRINAQDIENICSRVGWLSPYYLCLLLDQSMQVAEERIEEGPAIPGVGLEPEITPEDIDTAYERMISARSRFVHWHQRLKRDLSASELEYANTMLSVLSKSPSGMTREQLSGYLAKIESNPDARADQLQKLQLKLQEEGYVSSPDSEGRIRFLSFLLRDYWARNHG